MFAIWFGHDSIFVQVRHFLELKMAQCKRLEAIPMSIGWFAGFSRSGNFSSQDIAACKRNLFLSFWLAPAIMQ
jgi:hypothetical protein